MNRTESIKNRVLSFISIWMGIRSLRATVLPCALLLVLHGQLSSQHVKIFSSPEHGWGTTLGDDLVVFDRDNVNVHQSTILNSLTAERERTSPRWVRLSKQLLPRVLILVKAGTAELVVPTTAFDGDNLGFYFSIQTRSGVCPTSHELGNRDYLDKICRASLAKVHPDDSDYVVNTEKYSWRDINNTEAAIVEGWIDQDENTIAHWSITVIPGGDRVFVIESFASPQYRAEARLRGSQLIAGFRGGAWKHAEGVNPIFLMASGFCLLLLGWSLVHFSKLRKTREKDEDIFIETGQRTSYPHNDGSSTGLSEARSFADIIADDEFWESSKLWKQHDSVDPEDHEGGPNPGPASRHR